MKLTSVISDNIERKVLADHLLKSGTVERRANLSASYFRDEISKYMVLITNDSSIYVSFDDY